MDGLGWEQKATLRPGEAAPRGTVDLLLLQLLCLCCSEAFCPVKTEQVGVYIPVCLYRAPDEVSGEMAIV